MGIKRFFRQMTDPMVIILTVVIINAVPGVYQESKAEKAIEALRETARTWFTWAPPLYTVAALLWSPQRGWIPKWVRLQTLWCRQRKGRHLKLHRLSKILTWLVLGVCVVIFGVQILRAGGPDLHVVPDSFMVAVSLAVAAIPEGLAAVVTVVLSIGVTNVEYAIAIGLGVLAFFIVEIVKFFRRRAMAKA